jgi:hypothetical protein
MGWTWHRFFAATADEIPTLQAKYRQLKQKGEIGPNDLATFFIDGGHCGFFGQVPSPSALLGFRDHVHSGLRAATKRR